MPDARDPTDCNPPGSSVQGISSKSAGAGCHFLLQGIFPTQASNPSPPPRGRALHHGAAWEACSAGSCDLDLSPRPTPSNLAPQPRPQDTTAVWVVAWDCCQPRGLRAGLRGHPVSVCATSRVGNVRASQSLCGTESDCPVEKHVEHAASAEMRTRKLRSREVKRRAWGHTAGMEPGSEPRTDVSEERLALGTKPGCEAAGERSSSPASSALGYSRF